MVCVHKSTTDHALAWRVRDALAAHPLLGGATARIAVDASCRGVTLHGWTSDCEVEQLALCLAKRAAGYRPVGLVLNRNAFQHATSIG